MTAMTMRDESVSIVRSKVTKQGLMVLFSDGQVYLFHDSFLSGNRLHHADRVVNQDAIKSLGSQSS